jgi:hypothetical protein
VNILHLWWQINICITLALVQLVYIKRIPQLFKWLSDMLGQGINVYVLSLLGLFWYF